VNKTEEVVKETILTAGERVQRLMNVGLTRAANVILQKLDLKRKLAIAYEHYRFVRLKKIVEFNEKLRKKTHQFHILSITETYDTLKFESIDKFGRVPPDHVLASLETAIERKCFDSFEVAHIETVKKDPILFGRVNGCTDYFFIDQWDNDVKIEDILKENEG
jgi:hypothetical protein